MNPNFKDISREYREEFVDMAKNEVSLEELLANREKLVHQIRNLIDERDRKFLLSFVSNEPDWNLVRDARIKDFPSVKWKLFNQTKMKKDKVANYIEQVKSVLEM